MHFETRIGMGLMSLAATAAGIAAAEPLIVRDPLRTGAAWEFGQVMDGKDRDEVIADVEAAPFNRLGVSLTQRFVANGSFDMVVGVGGIFWNPFPNRASAAFTVNTQFGPGITEAAGIYRFGDPGDKSSDFLQFGYFPLKYNRDAANLGEYLFRSGTYPSLVFTGGPGSWSFVNGAFYMAQGARLHLESFGGALSQDFTLFFERDYAPMFDITPSYVLTFAPGESFRMAAGASWNHLIPMKPSQIRPKNQANHHVTFADFPRNEARHEVVIENGVAVRKTVRPEFGGGRMEGMWKDLEAYGYTDAQGLDVLNAKRYVNTLWVAGMPDSLRYLTADQKPTEKAWLNQVSNQYVDEAAVPTANENLWWDKARGVFVPESAVPDKADPNYDSVGIKTYVRSDLDKYGDGAYVYSREDYYFTYQGIKLMLMASLDFKPLLGGLSWLGPEDLRVFAELGVLGVEDQPLYYTDVRQRMPVMFGVNLPAFRLLDLLSLQFEYFNSPWPNDSRNFVYSLVPTYDLAGKSADAFAPIHADDWHWSVLAKKSWAYGNVYLQVASDYLRTNTYTSVPTYLPITDRFSQWYYAVRFEFGL